MFRVFTLLLIACAANAIENCADQAATQTLANAANNFAKISTQVILNGNNDNAVYSPLSAWLALSMATYGAQQETAEELKNLIQYSPVECSQRLKENLEQLKNDPNVTVWVVNLVIVNEKSKDIQPLFGNNVKKTLNAYVARIPDHKLQFVNSLNAWVSSATNKSITEIITTDDVDRNPALMILNAIYFNGFWKSRFETSPLTDPEYHRFYDLNNEIHTNIRIMENEDGLLGGDITTLNAKFVVLPYTNPNYKMVIITPNYDEKFCNASLFYEVKEKLKNFDYSELDKINLGDVSVSLPKFKIEKTIDMKDALIKLGAKEMFGDGANFDGIFGPNSNLKVEEIQQKVVIAVDELGTTASAVTQISVSTKMSTNWIKFDKPFFFALMSPHGILFEGQVTLPTTY